MSTDQGATADDANLPHSGPRYLTTEEVAALFRTSPETVRYWRSSATGPKSFRVGRRVLYDVADVEAFIASVRHGAA